MHEMYIHLKCVFSFGVLFLTVLGYCQIVMNTNWRVQMRMPHEYVELLIWKQIGAFWLEMGKIFAHLFCSTRDQTQVSCILGVCFTSELHL